MQENKNKLIEFASEHKLILANTWFQKGDSKLATHRAPETTPQSPLKRPFYDTIDYWLVSQRWKNSIANCDSDITANVKSDHCPLTITINLKLKAQNKAEKMPPRKNTANATKKLSSNTTLQFTKQ